MANNGAVITEFQETEKGALPAKKPTPANLVSTSPVSNGARLGSIGTFHGPKNQLGHLTLA